LIYEIDILTSR